MRRLHYTRTEACGKKSGMPPGHPNINCDETQGVRNLHVEPLALARRRSNVASGRFNASARAARGCCLKIRDQKWAHSRIGEAGCAAERCCARREPENKISRSH